MRGIAVRAESPCRVSVKMFEQVFAGIFKFISYQAEAKEPGSEGEFFVVTGRFGELSAFLPDALGAYCEGEVYVCFKFCVFRY